MFFLCLCCWSSWTPFCVIVVLHHQFGSTSEEKLFKWVLLWSLLSKQHYECYWLWFEFAADEFSLVGATQMLNGGYITSSIFSKFVFLYDFLSSAFVLCFLCSVLPLWFSVQWNLNHCSLDLGGIAKDRVIPKNSWHNLCFGVGWKLPPCCTQFLAVTMCFVAMSKCRAILLKIKHCMF